MDPCQTCGSVARQAQAQRRLAKKKSTFFNRRKTSERTETEDKCPSDGVADTSYGPDEELGGVLFFFNLLFVRHREVERDYLRCARANLVGRAQRRQLLVYIYIQFSTPSARRLALVRPFRFHLDPNSNGSTILRDII